MGIKEQLYKRKKGDAKYRGIEWDLDELTFSSLVNHKCYYCGSPPSNLFKYNKQELAYSGLDRVDSGKGYTIENVVSSCRFCNVLKLSLKPDTWFSFLTAVIESHGGKVPQSWLIYGDPNRANKAPNFWGRR